MSILLSLKLNERIFRTTESILKKMKKSRNAYFNEAVDFFNRIQKRKTLAEALKLESERVSKEGLAVLKAFEAFEDELP